MLEKLKSFLLNDQIFFAIIVVLVGIASFALGRASVVDLPSVPAKASVQSSLRAVVNTQETQATASVESSSLDTTVQAGALVASKSGTKYHLTSCPGAKQIKEENKIYFTDKRAAEAAGYKPAANCPQLP